MAGQAVLFDLDGTLLDTLEDLAAAMNRSLTACGWPTHALSAFREFIGDGARMLAERALPEAARSEPEIDRLLAEFAPDYGQNWAVETRIYPGIERMLERLEQQGVQLAVLSNKPDRYMPAIRTRFFAQVPFRLFRGQCEGIPRKPDPAGARLIAQELGVVPGDILYVGDSDIDMHTAAAAGMRACGVLWGYRDGEHLRAAGAQMLVSDPLEIPGLL